MGARLGMRTQTSRTGRVVLCALALVSSLATCVALPETQEETGGQVDLTVIEDGTAPEEPLQLEVTYDDEIEDEASASTSATIIPASPIESANYPYTSWSEEVAPEYYRIVDYAQIGVDLEPGSVTYSELDGLGRSGQAAACVTYEMMQAGRERGRRNMSGISPSGWGHNEEADIELVDGTFYHGMFWNRSHLIAKSLGGDEIIENLVTGTRMQNVGSNRGGGVSGGMAYCENLARMWLEDNPDGWLAYVATPVYEGDELVCRSVFVDMRSSDGLMDVRIEVYNAAKGYEVDYATGEFAPAG